MNTSCKDCIFAIYDSTTQIGCQLNKLDKYAEMGVELIEIRTEDKEYCLIRNKLCLHKRTKDWTAVKEGKEGLSQLVYEETRFSYQSIIDFGPKDDLNDLFLCLASIRSQQIQPKKVTVIKKLGNKVSSGQIAKALNSKANGWKWRVETQQESLPDGYFVDICINSEKFPFYIYSHVDSHYPVDLTEKLDKIVNRDMIDFGIISLDTNIDIVSTAVHVHYNGNSLGETLREKIIKDGFENKLLRWKNLQ